MEIYGPDVSLPSPELRAVNHILATLALSPDGRILRANSLFERLFDHDLDDLVGLESREILAADSEAGTTGVDWKALRAGRRQSLSLVGRRRDGRTLRLLGDYVPLRDPAGTVSEVIVLVQRAGERPWESAPAGPEDQGQIASIQASHCVASFALDGTILDANENFLRATGYRLSEIRGRHHRMFVTAAEAGGDGYARFWDELALGRHQAGEVRRIGAGGREVWLQATYNPILDTGGRPFKVVKYATDVTAERLRQADVRGQLEAIGRSQGVMALALDGTILEANDNILGALGYGRDDLVGHHHRMLVEAEHAVSADYGEFWQRLRAGTFHTGLYRRVGRGGREVWLQASYNPILDTDGRPLKVIKFAIDVTSNVAMAAAFADAQRQARHDSVTALPNRRRLDAFLAAGLSHPGARLALFYVDLDRFKALNEAHGNAVGDGILGAVADRLRRALKSDQIAARVGDDEFVIAAPGLGEEEAEAFAREILDLATQPAHHETGAITVAASVGVAVAPRDGETPDDLLRAADIALARAKGDGGGRIGYFESELNQRLAAERILAVDMRRALAAGEFFLEFQPRFDTRTRAVRSMEALVRWNHPQRGRISPGDFIPVAERSGLIVPLGRWVLEEACRLAASLPGVNVSVNVSPVQFRDPALASTVAEALGETGLAPGRLELEITEGALIEDGERARTVLEGLKSLGVRLAMDDFGTGYSSLGYLRDYPFDVIKIDQRFVADLGRGGGGRAIIQAILSLGAALGLAVTAEGVETNEQLLLLTHDRCREVQGFLLARPMKEDALRTFLRQPETMPPRRPSRLIEEIRA